MPKGYSRHYYDLICMARFPVKDSALADLALLRDVVRFKEKFYRAPSARYHLAVPGTFRLLPKDRGGKELERDYHRMRPMFFFGTSPMGLDSRPASSIGRRNQWEKNSGINLDCSTIQRFRCFLGGVEFSFLLAFAVLAFGLFDLGFFVVGGEAHADGF